MNNCPGIFLYHITHQTQTCLYKMWLFHLKKQNIKLHLKHEGMTHAGRKAPEGSHMGPARPWADPWSSLSIRCPSGFHGMLSQGDLPGCAIQ